MHGTLGMADVPLQPQLSQAVLYQLHPGTNWGNLFVAVNMAQESRPHAPDCG